MKNYIYKIFRGIRKNLHNYLNTVLAGTKDFTLKPDKILLVATDYIGDYCMRIIPILKLLKTKYPGSEISILTGSWTKDIANLNPNFRNIFIYNPAWLDRSDRKWSLLKKIKALNLINRNKHDLIIDVRGSIGIAFWYATKPARWICTLDLFLEMDLNKDLWVALKNNAIAVKSKYLQLSDDARDKVNEFVVSHGIDDKKRIITVHPKVNSIVKEWFPDRWAHVLDELVKKYNAEIIICGDKTSRSYAEAIAGYMRNSPYILAGKTTLAELAGLIDRSDLCLSIDSGPMHIAGLLDVPVVGLFGPNDPTTCSPLTDKFRAVYKDLPCSGCVENMMGCDVKCMDNISETDVLQAIVELNDDLQLFKEVNSHV